MMTLDDIAGGDLDAREARQVLQKAFADMTPAAAKRIYVALRAWVWKALNGRRRDSELRAWFDILKRTGAVMRRDHSALAERLEALQELISESITVSQVLPMEAVLHRRHVREALIQMQAEPGSKLERGRLGKLLGLQQANLSRVINLLTSAGLAERHALGKEAVIALTRAGQDVRLQNDLGLRGGTVVRVPMASTPASSTSEAFATDFVLVPVPLPGSTARLEKAATGKHLTRAEAVRSAKHLIAAGLVREAAGRHYGVPTLLPDPQGARPSARTGTPVVKGTVPATVIQPWDEARKADVV